MLGMDDTLAPANDVPAFWPEETWKRFAATGAAILIGALFLVSGIWKITDPLEWTTKVEQFKVPYSLSLPFTLLLAVGETWGGLMILVPQFRRWGAILLSVLLVVFMAYMGIHYAEFKSMDCSCFPLLKRAVGPGFFVGDGIMLLLAAIAGLWSRPPSGYRAAAVCLGAVVVATGACYAAAQSRVTGTKAPETLIVNGQPYSIEHGRVFLYFYDPECMHCDAAAKKMSKMSWGSSRVVAIPTRQQQFAEAFLRDTGLKAVTSLELEKLKKVFPFTDTPYGIALENGRQKGAVSRYDDAEPGESLKKLGLVE
jgi:uncharacterized membrane protein YphA (DoxX/SURF4 family)